MVTERRDADMPQPTSKSFKDHFFERAAGYAAHRPTYPAALVDFLAGVALRRSYGSEWLVFLSSFAILGAFNRTPSASAGPRAAESKTGRSRSRFC